MRYQTLTTALMIAAVGAPAYAQTISFASNAALSTENTGASYEGAISYDASLAQLSISLTNTTPTAIGGRLTAFAFRIDSTDPSASATLVSTTLTSFTNAGAGVSAAPFGTYDGGAGLRGTFLGGGDPNRGLAIGNSADFVFSVAAADAAILNSGSFMSGPMEFVARFRGLADGGSDKVPVSIVSPPDSPPVPAPGGVALAAVGGLMMCRRRR